MKATTIDFQQYFPAPIKKVIPHTGGLTNDNFIVITTEGIFFLRCPNSSLATLFDRKKEREILDLIKPLDIDIPYIMFNENNGVKISPYYENLRPYSEYDGKDKLACVAEVLKKLHSLNKLCGSDFDYINKLKSYRTSKKDSLHDLSAFKYLERSYLDYHGEKTLCHNDCVNGNILFLYRCGYLIDYEYAGDNYPIFDVTSFTTENDLKPRERGRFYRRYYGKVAQELAEDLELFEKLHHYLWCHWAMKMYAVKKEPAYQDIAQSKYENLNNYQRFIL